MKSKKSMALFAGGMVAGVAISVMVGTGQPDRGPRAGPIGITVCGVPEKGFAVVIDQTGRALVVYDNGMYLPVHVAMDDGTLIYPNLLTGGHDINPKEPAGLPSPWDLKKKK